MFEHYFAGKKVNLDRLEAFGFERDGQVFLYKEKILEDEFELLLTIDLDGNTSLKVMDLEFGEEYLALQNRNASGNFVGQVREACQLVLDKVAEACFTEQVFFSSQMNRLAKKITIAWQDAYDQPFEKHPEYHSYRIGGKWYALIFPLSLAKLEDEADLDQIVEVVNLKVNPDEMDALLAMDGIYPAYHMSKKSWISLVLDGRVTDDVAWDLLEKSRQLVGPSLAAKPGEATYWVLPANPKLYDIDSEFARSPYMDWPLKASIQKGDYLGIYITNPIRSLRYLCRVNDVTKNKMMKLECLVQFEDADFPAKRLAEFGVTHIRSARRMTKELAAELEKLLEG